MIKLVVMARSNPHSSMPSPARSPIGEEGEGDNGRKVEAVALVDEGEIEGFTDLAVGFWIRIIYMINHL